MTDDPWGEEIDEGSLPPMVSSPDYGKWVADQRRNGIIEALAANQREHKPKLGERLVKAEKFFGLDPESTGIDPNPAKKANFNDAAKRYFKKMGWEAERVDHFNVHSNRQHDLFGIFDYLAFGGKGYETIGVQITSQSAVSARKKKIIEAAWTPILVRAGWRILVLGFDKRGNEWIGHEHWLS